MKTINVSKATNIQLDWLVANCESHRVGIFNTGEVYLIDTPWANKSTVKWIAAFKPSVAWSQMGPIIEREGICLESEARDHSIWKARFNFTKHIWFRNPMRQIHTYCSMQGPTSLVAAARCYVVSRLGNVVQVPEGV